MSEPPSALNRLAREVMGEPADLVGFLALERGLLQPGQLEECLDLLEKEGFRRPLHEVLVERGYLGREAVNRLLPSAKPASLPPEAAESLRDPARRMGKFALVLEIGAGAGGSVWKAWDTDLNRWVAIKILIRPGQSHLARFLREAQMAARLSHPGIVAVHEVGEHEGRPYIVMQLVDGQSLKGARLTPREALEVILSVSQAVAFAHRQGVIHRDLKPNNILRDRQGRIAVADFGLARETDSAASLGSGVPVGTPAYMSPEQAAGRIAEIDARSDVYGVGATLYELLTGSPPFRGKTIADVLRQVTDCEPARPRALRPDIHPSVEAICLKAMAKEPRRRYPSAEALADDVTRFLRGEPVLARPPSLADRLARTVRRQAKGIVAAALAILAATAVLTRPRSSPPPPEPADESSFCDRAWSRKSKGDLPGALQDYTTAIRLRPDYGPAYYGRATVHQALGDEKAMLADLDEAIKRTKTDPQWTRHYAAACLLRGQHLLRSGDFHRAAEDFTRVLEWKPEDLDALAGRGECYLRTQKPFESVKDLELLLRLTPDVPAHVHEVFAEAKKHAQVEAHYFFDYSTGRQVSNAAVLLTELEENAFPSPDSYGCSMVFRKLGQSSATLRFSAPAAPWKAFLELEHLSTMDAPGSFRGSTKIAIIVNGTAAFPQWEVGQFNPFIVDRLAITKFLRQGENTVEVRLVDGTTCYWLKRIDVHCLYPAGTELPPAGSK